MTRSSDHEAGRAAGAPPRRPAASWITLLLLVVSLAACTGTQEGGRPVLLVVATEDGIEVVRHDPGEEEALALLPEAAASLSGIVDVAVARAAGPDENAVHVLAIHRQDGADLLQAFDATAVPSSDPGPLEAAGEPEDLSAIVADSETFPTGQTLCTESFDASDDGRWLALVHDPSACDPADEGRAFLLVDREPEPGDDALAHFENGQFMLPRFSPSGAVVYVVDEFFPDVVAFDVGPDVEPGDELDLDLAVTDIVGFAVDGAGRLVVAEPDAVLVLDPTADDEDEREPQESEPGLEAVLESDWPEGSTVVVRTSERLVVHPDLESEAEDPFCVTASLGAIADGVVGPFSFAYVLLDGALAVADLFDCDADEELDGGIIATSRRLTAPELADAVAVEWIFGVSAPDAP